MDDAIFVKLISKMGLVENVKLISKMGLREKGHYMLMIAIYMLKFSFMVWLGFSGFP